MAQSEPPERKAAAVDERQRAARRAVGMARDRARPRARRRGRVVVPYLHLFLGGGGRGGWRRRGAERVRTGARGGGRRTRARRRSARRRRRVGRGETRVFLRIVRTSPVISPATKTLSRGWNATSKGCSAHVAVATSPPSIVGESGRWWCRAERRTRAGKCGGGASAAREVGGEAPGAISPATQDFDFLAAPRRFVVPTNASEKTPPRPMLVSPRRGRHSAPREDTTPCSRISASDRARGGRKGPEVRCASTGRPTEGTFARSARERGSASTGGCDASARSAGARASASTGGSDTTARSAGARASACTGESEAGARSAGAQRSATTGGGEASARSAGARASASTGGGEAGTRRALAYPGSALATPRPRSRLRSRSSRSSMTWRTRARRTIRFNDIRVDTDARTPFLPRLSRRDGESTHTRNGALVHPRPIPFASPFPPPKNPLHSLVHPEHGLPPPPPARPPRPPPRTPRTRASRWASRASLSSPPPRDGRTWRPSRPSPREQTLRRRPPSSLVASSAAASARSTSSLHRVSQNPRAVTSLKIAAPVGTIAGRRDIPPYVTITPPRVSAPANAALDSPPTPLSANATGGNGASPLASIAAIASIASGLESSFPPPPPPPPPRLPPPSGTTSVAPSASSASASALHVASSLASPLRSVAIVATPISRHIWIAARPTADIGAFRATASRPGRRRTKSRSTRYAVGRLTTICAASSSGTLLGTGRRLDAGTVAHSRHVPSPGAFGITQDRAGSRPVAVGSTPSPNA